MSVAVQELERSRMEPERTEELVLVERAASGDEEAFRTLYERFADLLFAFICHSLDGARQEAEEVWQETLSAATSALATFRGQSGFFSWLCSIARHKLADHWRLQKRTGQRLALVPPEDLGRLMDDGPLPDALVEQRATCARVVEALGQLPPDYRAALVARYAEGRTVEEVAQLLDRSYKAAESVLSRAKEAFRSALAGQEEIEL